MAVEHSREPLGIDTAASLTTFVISAVAASLVMVETLTMSAYLLAHAGCAAFAILIAVSSGRPPRRQAILHAMMATALGPLGSAGTFLCAVFESCFRPFASPFSEWFDSIFHDENRYEAAVFLDRLWASEDPVDAAQRVTSYNDVLSNGTIEQKQAIIGLISRRFSPAFAPALRQALQDPVPAVRVQAAAAAAAIEGRYAEQSVELTKRAANPLASNDDLKAVANHLIEFAESGIAEKQRSEDAFELALKHLNAILNKNSNDAPALLSSAKILLRRGDAFEAHARLKRAIHLLGISPEIATLQIEALTQLGSFRELRTLAGHWAGRFAGTGRDGQRLEAALRVWTRGAVHG